MSTCYTGYYTMYLNHRHQHMFRIAHLSCYQFGRTSRRCIYYLSFHKSYKVHCMSCISSLQYRYRIWNCKYCCTEKRHQEYIFHLPHLNRDSQSQLCMKGSNYWKESMWHSLYYIRMNWNLHISLRLNFKLNLQYSKVHRFHLPCSSQQYMLDICYLLVLSILSNHDDTKHIIDWFHQRSILHCMNLHTDNF